MNQLTAQHMEKYPHLAGKGPEVDIEALPEDPMELFVEWFESAHEAGVTEPRAMTLSTVDEEGNPDARVVGISEAGEKGFSFGTGAQSPKSLQMTHSGTAAGSFWWQPQARAVRIRGTVSSVEPAPGFAVWTLKPEKFEFWQSTGPRSSLRIFYNLQEGSWSHQVNS